MARAGIGYLVLAVRRQPPSGFNAAGAIRRLISAQSERLYDEAQCPAAFNHPLTVVRLCG
jgi:hypothetical protein